MRHNEIGDDQLERELREDDVLLTAEEACEFIGGPKKPIDPSNLYRGSKPASITRRYIRRQGLAGGSNAG